MTNMFATRQECCALAGEYGGYTPNRSGSRCSSCRSVLGVIPDENTGEEIKEARFIIVPVSVL